MSRLHTENHLVGRIGWVRAAVLGAYDGIISTASLIVENQNTLDVRSGRDVRCQHLLDALGERLTKGNPDVLIVVGDDHHERFLNDILLASSEPSTRRIRQG
jgi:hypothetical protein